MHGQMAVVKGHQTKGKFLYNKDEGDIVDVDKLPPFEPPASGTLAYVKAGTGFGELATLAVAAARAATTIAVPTEVTGTVYCLELCLSLRGVISKAPPQYHRRVTRTVTPTATAASGGERSA